MINHVVLGAPFLDQAKRVFRENVSLTVDEGDMFHQGVVEYMYMILYMCIIVSGLSFSKIFQGWCRFFRRIPKVSRNSGYFEVNHHCK